MISIAPNSNTYLGVFTSAYGVEADQFRAGSGVNPAIVHLHVDWTTPGTGDVRTLVDFNTEHPDVGTSVADLVAQSAQNNQVFALSWDPFSRDFTGDDLYYGNDAPEISAQQILNGELDGYIRQVAAQVAAFDAPVMMSLFGEANAAALFAYGADGASYMETQDDRSGHYGDPSVDDGPERIKDAYKHVIDLFRAEGADNVDWFMYLSTDVMGDPTAIHPADIYPGDDYVDWIGQSLYVNGPADVATSLDAGYAAWRSVSNNPFFIPELGIEGVNNPNALGETLDLLAANYDIDAITLTDFAAAEGEYGVPRLGTRPGDWTAINSTPGYEQEVQIVEDGATPLTMSEWRAATGRDGLDNLFMGTAGSDYIAGSDDADQMIGEAGDDIYVVNHINDLIVEGANGGFDIVLASADHALTAEVEMLLMEGSANLTGSGNQGANSLFGNAGNNWILGLAGADTIDGGAGADTMEGGAGDDVYVVDNIGDAVVEAADAGNDLVVSDVNMTLGANIETLLLQGTADLTAVGNDQNNSILGNSGANQIAAAGGDDYVAADAGNDTVNGGNGDDILDGGAGDDQLFGEAGQDVLEGGAGNDQLTFGGGDYAVGGTGADQFVFLAEGGLSIVEDFTAGEDVFDLTGFGLSGMSALSARSFDAEGSLFVAMDDGSQVLLQDVVFSDLSASDVIF